MSDSKIIANFINYNFPELIFKPCDTKYNDWYGFAHLKDPCAGHPAILRLETDQVVVLNQLSAWVYSHDLKDSFGNFKQYGTIDGFYHLSLPLSNPNILDILKPLVEICIAQWKDQHAKCCKWKNQRRRSNPKDAN